MPATNPLLAASDGGPVVYTPGVESLVQGNALPAALSGDVAMNQTGGAATTQVNAAGTSENVNVHVAAVVIVALVGAWGLHRLGFKFAATGSVGIGK